MNRRLQTAGLSSGIHDDFVERMVLNSHYDAMRKVAVVPYCFAQTKERVVTCPESVTPEPGRGRPQSVPAACRVGSGVVDEYQACRRISG
jgi:hypothetical protein